MIKMNRILQFPYFTKIGMIGFLIFTSFLSFAQQKIIVKGNVFAENNVPLAGVSVNIKGSFGGTATDAEGKFTIQVGKGATLVLTFVGYEEKQVIVNNEKSAVNIQMVPITSTLDNVIVAYGVQKKMTVTGAISSIQTKEIKQSPAANLAVTLAGRLPGLTAIQTSGEPGRDATLLYLRGQGTINGQNPIILVDGVPRGISSIDPNEVETITILKDASATAMFGVRGANGVILVTTKRGKSGKPAINLTAESGIQGFTTVPSTVDAYDYARLRNQAGSNDSLGQNFFFSETALQHYKLGDDPLRYPNNNWPKLLMHKYTPQTRYDLNLSGGGEYVHYFINAGYLHQGGLWKVDQKSYDPSSFMNRYNFRSNIDAYLNTNKTLKAFLNVAGYLEKVNSPNTLTGYPIELKNFLLLSFLYATPPIQAGPLTPAGQVESSGRYWSPYGAINRSGYAQESRSNVTSSFGMEKDLKSITPGLSAKFMMSFDTRAVYDLIASQSYEQWNEVVNPNLQGVDGKDSVSYAKSTNDVNTPLSTSTTTTFQSYTNVQFFLNYHRTFGKHTVSGLVLAQQDQRIQPGDRLPFNLRGLSSRITYGYDNRYFAEFDAGYNGSEQFAKGRRYGFFPAVSAGWAISNEKFLKDNPVISLLKLRGSYGEVGNDQLGSQRFLYLDNISVAGGGGYSQNVGLGQTVNEISLGNPALSWEIARKSNFGLDLGLFNQLNISVDIYNEKRDNMLINRQTIPALNGFPGTLPPLNLGRMTNHGYEIELNYNKSINKDLAVLVKLNFNHAKNKVEFIDEPKRTADYAYQYRQTGYSYGQFFGYVANGFWSSQAEINNSGLTFAGTQPRPGDLKFVDINGDKIIDEKDIAPLGYTPVPQYTYGAAFSVNYKNFDISVLFQGVAKVSNYFTGWGVFENVVIPVFRSRMLNAWTPERAKAGLPIDFPALSSTTSSSEAVNSSFWLENTSYLRLKNVEIGYTLPLKWSEKIGSDKIRVYSNGLNIFTWSKMHNKDFDPELAQQGTLTYPIEKVFNFGINVEF